MQTVVVGGLLFWCDLDLTWAWQLTPFLRFGPELNDKWILWAHDIYGPESGRTKEYCNKMWTDLGVTCILPDFFRGTVWPVPSPTWEGQLRWALVFPNPNTSSFKSAKVKASSLHIVSTSSQSPLITLLWLPYWILSQKSCLVGGFSGSNWELRTRIEPEPELDNVLLERTGSSKWIPICWREVPGGWGR